MSAKSLVTRTFIDPCDVPFVRRCFSEIERHPINSKYRTSTIERGRNHVRLMRHDMARFYYECNADLRNSTEESETIKPYTCTQDKYCLYCNSQCCLLIQRRPPRHVWEAWYFWLGVALLAVFIISSVSSYIVSNCRHNIQGVPLRHSAHGNQRNDRGGTRPGNNQNEISISIIPTSEFFPSHRKMFVIASQPAVNHLSRRCVCTSKACKEAGVDTCRTKFYCYTELILTGDQEFGANTTTRGCTKFVFQLSREICPNGEIQC
ncbi:hypothetical protein WN51_04342 [Melipona quadrifasciata]|uniref:Uncharacterized protein n=1 Tax=Melipona quadrifasciata TaxID=166423 RepID=A0A0M8ZQX7_9HYME|nr:hypothetical protein WN51_04342 [Melipona quadrifasciata]